MTTTITPVPWPPTGAGARTNLFNNPSGRVSVTGYNILNGNTPGTNGQDAYTSATAAVARGSVALFIEQMGIDGGGKLLPNTAYTFAADIYGNPGAPVLMATGPGVAGTVFSADGVGNAGTVRRVITFTTASSGLINFGVSNATTSQVNWFYAFHDAILEQGTTSGAYFDGSTPDARATAYYWVGAANASQSVAQQLAPTVVLSPRLVLGYQTSNEAGTIVHRLLSGAVRFALRPASPRAGTLDLFFLTRAEAWAAKQDLLAASTFEYTDTDLPETTMIFAVTGEVDIALDEQTRAYWTVKVPYQEGPET